MHYRAMDGCTVSGPCRELAAPEHDKGALEDAIRAAKVRSIRKRPPLYDVTQRTESDEGGKP